MLIPLRDADLARCGHKAATLGRLLAAGLPVPDGVVLPFGVGEGDVERCANEAWDAMAPGPVAVRSSADGEDSPEASMAGQHETILGARTAPEVAQAVRVCLDSVSSDRAAAYRRRTGAAEPPMAVLVQRMVPADVAGVMFVTGSAVVVEAARGLGAAVVEGRVTPCRYQADPDGTVRRVTAASDALSGAVDILDDAALAALVALGRAVMALLGADQDIEWALADGTFWILQARPITAPLPDVATPRLDAARPSSSVTITGTPGSAGTATGPARIVRGPADFARVHSGDILVCPFTDPAWTPLLAVAAGVVTRTGGMLSHAAIVAREFGIPAVLGVPDALLRIVDGDAVTVDGDAGTVTLASPA